MNNVKKDFFSQIQAPNVQQIISDAILYETSSYDAIMMDKRFTHNTGRTPSADIEALAKPIYESWYSLMKVRKQQVLTPEFVRDYPEYANYINLVCSDPSFTSANVEKQGGYFKKLRELSEEDCKYKPVKGQDYFTHFQSYRYLGGGTKDFENIECRFYLNLKAMHIAKFCLELVKRCGSSNIPMYYKTGFDDSRCDTIIIYSTYQKEHYKKTLEIIQQIKKEKPELFVGAEKTPQLCGAIDGYIGFGEEPSKPNESFNHIRANAIGEIVKEANKKITPYLCQKLLDPNTKLQDANGQNVAIVQYIKQLFLQNVPHLIDQEIRRTKYNINSPQYKALYPDSESWLKPNLSRLEKQKQDLAELNNDGKTMVQFAMDRFIEEIKKGKIPHSFEIPSSKGHSTYMHYNVNMQIRDLFRSEIEKIAQPFLETNYIDGVLSKHDISSNNFHLNESTTKQMSNTTNQHRQNLSLHSTQTVTLNDDETTDPDEITMPLPPEPQTQQNVSGTIDYKTELENLRISALLDEYVVIKSKWLTLPNNAGLANVGITAQDQKAISDEAKEFEKSGKRKAALEKELSAQPPISQKEYKDKKEEIGFACAANIMNYDSSKLSSRGDYWCFNVEENVKGICNIVAKEIKELQTLTDHAAQNPANSFPTELKTLIILQQKAVAEGKELTGKTSYKGHLYENKALLKILLAEQGQLSCQKFRGETITQQTTQQNAQNSI